MLSRRIQEEEKRLEEDEEEEMADDIAGEEVDAVFAAALAGGAPQGCRNAFCDARSASLSSVSESADDQRTDARRNAKKKTRRRVPPPRFRGNSSSSSNNNNNNNSKVWRRTTAVRLSAFVRANEDEKILEAEMEEEKVITTAREAFLATFANFREERDARRCCRRGTKKSSVTIGNSKLKNPPPDRFDCNPRSD